MSTNELIIDIFDKTRQSSFAFWKSIPQAQLYWKPTRSGRSILETIRHVLETEHLLHETIRRNGNLGHYESPWKNFSIWDLDSEMTFANHFRKHLLEDIKLYDQSAFLRNQIKRTEFDRPARTLGDCLTKIAGHEARHVGKMRKELASYDPGKKIHLRLV